jgi:hypothetical protein
MPETITPSGSCRGCGTDSRMCLGRISRLPAVSAIVRPTFKMQSDARAENPNRINGPGYSQSLEADSSAAGISCDHARQSAFNCPRGLLQSLGMHSSGGLTLADLHDLYQGLAQGIENTAGLELHGHAITQKHVLTVSCSASASMTRQKLRSPVSYGGASMRCVQDLCRAERPRTLLRLFIKRARRLFDSNTGNATAGLPRAPSECSQSSRPKDLTALQQARFNVI